MGLLHPKTNASEIMKTKNAFILAIGLLGSLQIIGYATGSRTLRGLGLATGFAPYPKVFCEADGYEPFAASFIISGEDDQGNTVEIPLTAERYARLDGPYQRRNVYGAALAYAPRLPEDMRNHLFDGILNNDSTLREELDLPELFHPEIKIQAREGESTPHYQFQLD